MIPVPFPELRVDCLVGGRATSIPILRGWPILSPDNDKSLHHFSALVFFSQLRVSPGKQKVGFFRTWIVLDRRTEMTHRICRAMFFKKYPSHLALCRRIVVVGRQRLLKYALFTGFILF